MEIKMNLGENSYIITIEKNALLKADKIFNLNRKVLVITDEGVPPAYAERVKSLCSEGYVLTLPMGEQSKSFEGLKRILSFLVNHGFKRSDCLVAVGGGVMGDLGGFAASTYMRGIDFYNVPTTTLSQIDSSIGGKCAINFEGIKNIIGAFYQPKAVLIDTNVLSSLDARQVSSGLVEAVKMAATFDEELFSLLEKGNPLENIDEIIVKSLNIKKNVVEQDEKEAGLRKVLNFGHTIGHGIESFFRGQLYHGECVAAGMEYMCSEKVKERIRAACKNIGVAAAPEFDADRVVEIAAHDKKATGGGIDIVWVDKIGEFELKKMSLNEIKKLISKGHGI